jgi:KaiC/GvpD/RAD55 family RecA-like ATPase
MSKSELNRAISLDELERTKFKEFDWDGPWLEFFGDIEFAGTMLAWGESGNGKTSLALQLCRYLAERGIRTAYDSLEQGRSKSMQKQVRLAGLTSSNIPRGKFKLLDKEPIEDLKERLRKRRSPEFVVIDSLQYSGMKYRDYQILKDEFSSTKLIMILSHADGKKPYGRVANSIRYDADTKIRIEGYRAFTLSRMGGGKPFTIWEEGAKVYYNEDL